LWSIITSKSPLFLIDLRFTRNFLAAMNWDYNPSWLEAQAGRK